MRPHFEIIDWDTHHADHRLYVATSNQVLTVDANNDPWVVDIFDGIEPTALEVDATNGRLLVATSDDIIHSFSAEDTTYLGQLPPHGLDPAKVLEVDSSGILHIATDCHLYIETPSGWQDVPLSTSSGSTVQGPCDGSPQQSDG